MISVIDIGTNTILMLTVNVSDSGSVEVVDDHHEIARLGRGVDAAHMILPETFDRIQGFLVRYRAMAEALGSERIVAFGTSALRDARNRDEFIAAMIDRTGIAIEVVSGDDEARWTYAGALFELGLSSTRVAVIDIGGGSTELAFGDGRTVERALSIDIGAVRITERCFPSLPPSRAQLDIARSWASDQARRFFELPSSTTLVGVAGTVTTLGAIANGHDRFDANELNGAMLTVAQVAEIAERLSQLTIEQSSTIPQVSAGRADIILGGATILLATMQRLDANEIVVSTRGLRYGIALREARRDEQ